MSSLEPGQRSHLAKIARLYFLEGESQAAIARRFGISIATVSRAIAKAKDEKIVEFRINDDAGHFGELELHLEREWNLAECMIVRGFEDSLTTFAALATALTEMLQRLLRDGSVVGVSWGETLKAIGEHLGPVRTPGVRVVPIIGTMGDIETGIYPNSIARSFADGLSARQYLLNLPALVDNRAIRDAMVEDSHYRTVQALWATLSVAILSVSGLNESTSMYRSGILSAAELRELRDAGGACASNFTILDERGQPIENPITDRLLGLPFRDLERIQHVIVVAEGSAKAPALRAALKSGVVDRVIVDERCASEVDSLQFPV